MAKKVTKKATRKQGAPTKLTKDKREFILYLARQGKTDKQIAKTVGIAERTLNLWKEKDSDFMQSIKEAKRNKDEEVENALLQTALGYHYYEEKVISVSDGQGMGSHVESHQVEQYKPGETRAQMFWLMNRQPEKWRQTKAVEVTGKDGGAISVEHTLGNILDEIDGTSAGLGTHEE